MRTAMQSWWNRLRVQQKVWTILLVVFVPVVLAFALHVELINTLLTLQRQSDQIATARQQILILRRLAVDIEDAFRGYLLTRKESFLVPLLEAEPSVTPTAVKAISMVAGIPGMAADIKSATARLEELLHSKHTLIQQVRGGGLADVLRYVRSGKGMVLSDAVRDDFRLIEDQLENRLIILEIQEAVLARRAFWGLLLALGGGIALGLLCARLLSRSITRPLGVLQASASEIGRHPQEILASVPIAIRSEDEIGRLARSFEDMALRIRHHIQELEALNATGHDINTIGPDGLEGVLRRITDRAAELLKVDVCLLMVRHERMGCWIVEAASGEWNDRLQKTVMLWEEFPVSVQAYQTAQPAIGEDLRADIRMQRRNLIGQSMLSVPLLSQGVPFGVLVLLLDRKVPREAWNVRLAKGFADDAAIAIANGRLYEAVHQKERGLELRLKQLEHLAETLAHDLKGPGERMEGLASMVLAEYGRVLDGRGGRWLRLIEENGKELIARVENILQVARVGAGSDSVEAVDVEQVIEEVLKVRAAELQQVCVSVHMERGFPPVACHRGYLRQIFDNLISNAIKFANGPKAEIRLSAQLQGATAWFSVTDNGPGIPAQHRERVFEPFVRLTPDGTRGSGIGLTIVKRIVELYGGKVSVDGAQPSGCTVSFTLPLLGSLSADRRTMEVTR
jgi:signal transduction histidine kinase/CHASE3 domain sensor protein